MNNLFHRKRPSTRYKVTVRYLIMSTISDLRDQATENSKTDHFGSLQISALGIQVVRSGEPITIINYGH